MSHVTFTTPSPLWNLAFEDADLRPFRFRAPVLLRFVGDTFMQQLDQVLKSDPGRVASLVARHENWEKPDVGWLSEAELATASSPALYQPAHNRHYLVTASLICKKHGAPDHTVDARSKETVSFVLRRLSEAPGSAKDSSPDELAWVGTQHAGQWLPASRDALLQGELQHGMFGVGISDPAEKRKLHAGYLPVAARDVFERGAAASRLPAIVPNAPAGGAAAHVRDEREGTLLPLSEGLKQLASLALPASLDELGADTELQEWNSLGTQRGEFRLGAAEQLLNVLLSLAEFVKTELSEVWNSPPGGTPSLSSAERALVDLLHNGGTLSGKALLVAALNQAEQMALRGIDRDLWQAVTQTSELSVEKVRTVASRLWRSGNFWPRARNALGDPYHAQFRKVVSGAGSDLTRAAEVEQLYEARLALASGSLLLAEYFEQHLPELWQALQGAAATPPTGALGNLWQHLQTTRLEGDLSLRELLADVAQHRGRILLGQLEPGLLVVRRNFSVAAVREAAASLQSPALSALVLAALQAAPPPNPALPTSKSPPSESGADAGGYYVVRCVYRRPQREPFCPPLLSERSLPFQLASFFDFAAPARPVEIRLPFSNLSELRKSARGLSVALNARLRAKLSRVERADAEKVLDGELAPPAPPLYAVIWTLSIPIVTICAMIILMIIVYILNYVFWWLPFLRIMIPIRVR